MAKPLKFPDLCGEIVKKYGTRADFAYALGWSAGKLSMKLCGRSDWTRLEMIKVLSALNIPSSEIESYFFADQIQSALKSDRKEGVQ